MQNEPFLEAEFYNLPPGEYVFELSSPVELQQRLQVSTSKVSVFFTHSALTDPSLHHVSIRCIGIRNGLEEEFTLPTIVHCIRGQVRDFEDRPFPAYLWAVERNIERLQAMVKTDEEGNFVFWYPEGREARIFVDDESYSQATYECWVTIEGLYGDIEINPRVGNFELWGLHCWHNDLIWQVYFWPVSLPLDLRAKGEGWEHFCHPRLAEDEVVVRVNGEEVAVKGMHNVQVWAGEGRKHPACLLEFPVLKREGCEPTLIQVEVCAKTRGRGEAWYVVW
jgi:hypothetical protein